MGLWASIITLRYFKHGAMILEADDASRVLALAAATMFVFAEMGAFGLFSLLPAQRMYDLRWKLITFVVAVLALEIVNIDLTAFSVFGGALGVGIGLGLQKLAANYVSGFVVLLERSVRIGDVIKVDNFEGRVTDITARFTSLRSVTGIEAILPNDMLVNQRVENSSLIDTRVWHWLPVTVSYGSDVELVRRLLVEAAATQSRVAREPEPAAFLHGDLNPEVQHR